jgi:hypothetical protein
MGIINIFKAFSAINKANKFVKQHEDAVSKVQQLAEKVKGAIAYYTEHKEQIEGYIETAKTVVAKLEQITGK